MNTTPVLWASLVAAHCLFYFMANTIWILSWNVQGLANTVKRLAVFQTVKRLKADIVCLQETNFLPATPPCLTTFRYQYHATYSTYARGVGILLCKHVLTDSNGCYVFILCELYGVSCLIAGVYIPPPFSAEVLKTLGNLYGSLSWHTTASGGGAYKNLLDSHWYKLFPTSQNSSPTGRVAPTKMFSWYSATLWWFIQDKPGPRQQLFSFAFTSLPIWTQAYLGSLPFSGGTSVPYRPATL